MIGNLYGNPHSASDPARASGEAVDTIRDRALAFFQADPEHFDLVFTANATAAVKLVAESFRDLAAASSTSGTFWYGYHKDCHTSLVGVREYADGNHHCFGSDREVEEWLNGYPVQMNASNDGTLPGLFAYPGQSNMTGRRLPISWTGELRQSTKIQHQNTYSLFDAAALATSAQLDLSDPEIAPDFTALSFYKTFGFPDLGALIIRKKSGHILSWRRYFGGGTVNMLTVLHEATVHRKDNVLHEGLEDGTLPFHSIVALGCAMDVHKNLYGSMKAISLHTSFLGNRLYNGMSSLYHQNGRPVCIIYNDFGESPPYTDPSKQGATVAFNIVRANGTYIRYSTVEQLANTKNIYLRAGGLCNPGGVASHLKVEPWQFKRAWSAGHRCGEAEGLEVIGGKPTGVVRASLGAMSTLNDVDTLVTFLSDTFVESGDEMAPPGTDIQHRVALRDVQNNEETGFKFDGAGRVAARQPQPQRQSPRVLSKNEVRDCGDACFDLKVQPRIAPRLPQQPRHKASTLNSKKPKSSTLLGTKRYFFFRSSSDTHLVPLSEISPTSEMSRSTLTLEEAELQDLLKQNMALIAEEERSVLRKSKSTLRFWKASGAKKVVSPECV